MTEATPENCQRVLNMEPDRGKKRERERSMVGPGTDEEDPEEDDRGKPTGAVGRWGRRKPEKVRHLPGVLDWEKEKDLGDYLRERGALDLMIRSDLRNPDIYLLQRMAARCALEDMDEQLKFSEERAARAEEIISYQEGVIGGLEAELYNRGVVSTSDGKDSEGERWTAGTEGRKEQRTLQTQRRRQDTAVQARKEMSVWKEMKLELVRLRCQHTPWHTHSCP
jgi:hypothetical protein